MVSVKEIMHAITVVEAGDSVHDVARLMERKNIGSVLVRSGGELKGILTERDMLKRVVARALDVTATRAGEVMSPLVHTIKHDADVLEASRMFRENHIRRLPVTEGGRIIGLITARDVAKSMPFEIQSALSNARRLGREGLFGD
ncbi:MAG: CBS domain-containing protein [Candidatus ainarchaeum sp.]|nr:CBS domain-containing protein [Candidatus ainarchaeum sp.]